MPGGALEVIAAGALDGVAHVFGLHCDPSMWHRLQSVGFVLAVLRSTD